MISVVAIFLFSLTTIVWVKSVEMTIYPKGTTSCSYKMDQQMEILDPMDGRNCKEEDKEER